VDPGPPSAAIDAPSTTVALSVVGAGFQWKSSGPPHISVARLPITDSPPVALPATESMKMKVSAARSAQVPAVVVVDARELEVVGAAVLGVVGIVLETGDDEDVEDDDPTEVVALVVVVATLEVPQAQSSVKTPTIATHGRTRETDGSSECSDVLC